jgi:hypothetical protein
MLSNFAISDSQPNAQRTGRKKLSGLHQAVLLVGVVMYSSASFAQSAANISNSDKDLIQALLRRRRTT